MIDFDKYGLNDIPETPEVEEENDGILEQTFDDVVEEVQNYKDEKPVVHQEPVSRKTPGKANIVVVGVGGGGNNAVNNMIRAGIKSASFVVMNTDLQALNMSLVPPQCKIQLGNSQTGGLGAGSDPEVGRLAAEESRETIKAALKGIDLLFVTAGMGGGTGTGAAPVIAEIAKSMGILTVAVVTKPFNFEGALRMKNAEMGIRNLQNFVDTLLVIPTKNSSKFLTKTFHSSAHLKSQTTFSVKVSKVSVTSSQTPNSSTLTLQTSEQSFATKVLLIWVSATAKAKRESSKQFAEQCSHPSSKQTSKAQPASSSTSAVVKICSSVKSPKHATSSNKLLIPLQTSSSAQHLYPTRRILKSQSSQPVSWTKMQHLHVA